MCRLQAILVAQDEGGECFEIGQTCRLSLMANE